MAGSIPEHAADTNPQTSKHLLKRVQGDVLATNFEALEGGNGKLPFLDPEVVSVHDEYEKGDWDRCE